MTKRLKIYIACPYTRGDVAMNVRRAVIAQDYIEECLKQMAYNPLLSHFQHLINPHEEVEYWYEKDIHWLKECDAVLRLPGESVGADREVEIARGLGMPVYEFMADIPRFEE